MKVLENKPPRKYQVGTHVSVTISDCGKVYLESDEQVTFVTDQGGEYDVTRKEWGFYATPSLNKRLPSYKLRPVLVRNSMNHFFVLLMEEGKEDLFNRYLVDEKLEIVTWLDSQHNINQIKS